MKKWLVFSSLLLVLLLYSVSSKYGFRIGDLSISFAPEKEEIFNSMKRFIEDIQFKDFSHAATFHSNSDQAEEDIPKKIEKRFVVKPELLDIKAFDILGVELNDLGKRAKVRTQWHVKLLNSDERRDVDVIFYWYKKDGKWFMDLKSSL